MLSFSRGLESGCKRASFYYSGIKVNKKQDTQLQRISAGYWYVYRECLRKLETGIIDISEVERFARAVRKIKGRELVAGVPHSVIYQACADAAYDKLYGKKRRGDCSFSLRQGGYIFLGDNKIRMLGVDGDIRLTAGFSSIPDEQNNVTFDWSRKSNQWLFSFWSSTVA